MKRVTRNVPSDGPDQQCSKCDEIKPRSEFYVKYQASGTLFPWCKACHKKKQTKVKPRIVDGEPRDCRTCGKNKPDADFRPGHWTCKACDYEKSLVTSAARSAKYNAAHREQRAEVAREKYRADPVNKAARVRELRETNRDRFVAAERKWRRNNPASLLVNDHRRRSCERDAEGSFTLEEWNALKARYDYTCLWCRKREPDIILSPDHIVALSRGGSSWIANIQPLCCGTATSKIRGCQYKKHNRNFDFRPYWTGDVPEHPEFE